MPGIMRVLGYPLCYLSMVVGAALLLPANFFLWAQEPDQPVVVKTIPDPVFPPESDQVDRPELPTLTVEEAIKAIQSPDPHEIYRGAQTLVLSEGAAKKALSTMIEVLDKQPLDGPEHLLHVLVHLGPDAAPAVPVLIKYTGSSNFHSRYLACRALGRIGEPARSAVPIMIRLLNEEVSSVRRNAAEALGRLGDKIAPDAVEPLMKATRDPLDPVREAAILALGNFGTLAEPAIPLLQEILRDERNSARPEAALSLWLLTKDPEPILPVLRELLKYGHLEWEAAQVMTTMGPAAEPAVPDLIKALKGDDTMQIFVAEALGSIGKGAAPALPALRKLLDNKEEGVRVIAQQAIDKIEGK